MLGPHVDTVNINHQTLFGETMVDLSFLVSDLSAISSLAVILGAVFVVFQLRQNARLIKTANFETKANMFIFSSGNNHSGILRPSKEKHARRCKEIQPAQLGGFDDSLEDFEARNFGYI